jgi:hypothetical protein
MNNLETNKENVEDFFNFGAQKEKPKAPQMAPLQPMIETKVAVAGIQPAIQTKAPVELKISTPNRETEESESEGMTYKGEIPNHPTRKFYPERTFDQYVKKDARLEESDVELLKSWAGNIANYKRKSKLNSGSNNRITDNTILRIMLSEFCDKLAVELKNPNFKEVGTEEELRIAITKIMNIK